MHRDRLRSELLMTDAYWLIEAVELPIEFFSIATSLRLNIAWLLDEDWLILFDDLWRFFSPYLRIFIASSVLNIGTWVKPFYL
jgi:hypothetical protein